MLEQESDELRTVIEKQQDGRRKSEQRIAELETQLTTVNEDLSKSNAIAQAHERQKLKEKLNFCRYRADTLAHLADMRKDIRQITDHDNAKTRECNALRQAAAQLKTQLEAEMTKTEEQTAEISQYNGVLKVSKQEKTDAIEKEGRTRELLQSAEDSNRKLQTEINELSTEIAATCADLLASKNAEQRLASQCSGLQKQLKALQDAKSASDERLRQVQDGSEVRLQQVKTDCVASIDELKSDLKLSEDARKELQAKMRRMETGHKEQLEHHQQTFDTKLNDLVVKSEQEQEKLKAKHQQEMERCEQDVEARVADMSRGVLDLKRQLREAALPTTTTLVPNTQQPEQTSRSSSQQSHPGRTRKKVDRQTNSVTVVVSSSHRRLESAEGQSIIDRAAISDHRQEGSENQTGYFEQAYESRFGCQTVPQDQETQLSALNSEAEIVPETQDFEYGQGVASQSEIIESQVVASDEADEGNLTDLSTMPSEDLSEMLMDMHPTSRQQRRTPKHVSSPSGELRTPGQSAHDTTPYARLTNSRDRPKSRANTASRMMPLPHQDGQHQRTHADQGPDCVSHEHVEGSFREDNNDSTDFMHPNNAISKRTYGHRSVHEVETGQKRKTSGSVNDSGSFKKLRTSAQAFAHRPSSISKSYAPYTPPSTNTSAQNTSNLSPASLTGRRTSYRQSSTAGSRGVTPRLSSTRNTRSKGL